MTELIQYMIPVFALTAVCAGWIGVQMLARRLGTKHHLSDRQATSCGNCGCHQKCEVPQDKLTES